ncbi:MAG: hypothetical protein GY835_01190 [bacterium]|nr:hypothetical protein [bacterium]
MSENSTQQESPNLLSGLIILGIGSIAMGVLFVLGGLGLLALSYVAPADPALADQVNPAPSAILLFTLAAVSIVLGIGTMRARRWARALQLIFSITGLLVMILCGGMSILIFRVIINSPESTFGQFYSAEEIAAVFPVVVVFSVIGVLVPLAYLLFFRRAAVKATCERLNPQPDWSDRCPLPVLTLCKLLLLSAFSMMLLVPLSSSQTTAVQGFPLPAALGLAAAFILLTVEVYRLRRWALWGAALLVLVLQIFMLAGSMAMDMSAIYPPELVVGDAEQLTSSGEMLKTFNIVVTVLLSLLWLGYCFWLRKFFTTDNDPDD